MIGVPEAAVSNRRRVGDEAQHGGEKRVEAETDEDGAADGHGRATAGRPLRERR